MNAYVPFMVFHTSPACATCHIYAFLPVPGRPSKARQDAAAPRRRQTAKPAAAAAARSVHIHRQAADKISNQLSDQEIVSEEKIANTFK